MKSLPSKKRIKYLRLLAVAIILTIAAGWILTGYLGGVADKIFKGRVERDANVIVASIRDSADDVEQAAYVLSQAEQLAAALSSGSPADLARANKLLDRVKGSLRMSISYLLDRNGLTVSSTNRSDATSYVGKSFATRSYAKGALAGRLTAYFAVGILTGERGYYAAAPVVDSKGTIKGVVVSKRNIDFFDDFFRNYPNAFLVSPEGIIFASSRPELLFRTMWPVDERKRAELLASKQFGNIRFEPLLAAEPRTGTNAGFNGKDHYVQRLPIGHNGWTLVLMEQPDIVSNYRLFGIALTGVFGLLLLLFFNVLLNKSKSLEAARGLLKAKDDWRRTFDAVPDLIAAIDSDNRILMMNRALAKRLGMSPDDAIGRRCYELLHCSQEPSPSCPHLSMLISGKSESVSLFEKHLNGDFIVTTTPILAEDGTIESSVHVMHDVSEHKRLIEEVNRNQNLESIGLLAGGLAHDFNNVLNIIYGNITFARMLAGDNKAIAESLTDAEEACERAKNLGIRLQAFSQGSSPVKEPIVLAALIGEAAETIFEGSNIMHSISTAEDIFPVKADPGQIRRVFDKLLTNAKEAMPESGTIKIEIENYVDDGKKESLLGSGHYVRITLQDDGRGIPEEHLLKIFDPYFSTKDSFSQKGLGLGLSMCYSVLKRHRGHIFVESKLGVGTSITLYLPASEDETKNSPERWL